MNKIIHYEEEIRSYMAKLPFDMPTAKIPQFPDKDFNITDYGAKGDGVTNNTDAFAKAITDCHESGGGRVFVPSGTWLTGPILLNSNVNLYVEQGALIVFSANHDEYPVIKSPKGDSYKVQSPIYGINLTNIAITGNGTFNGNGHTWRPVKKFKMTEAKWESLVSSGGVTTNNGLTWWPTQRGADAPSFINQHTSKEITAMDCENFKEYFRPYMLNLVHCKSVLIDGPTLENSPRFAMYMYGCEDIVIRDTKVFNEWYAQNGDGLDFSGGKNIFMYKCMVSCGDDAICMKSSKDEALNGNEPALQNVVIADCIVNRGHGGFTIGSAIDGGIKNIYVRNCTYIGTDIGLRFKGVAGKEGLAENIFIDDIKMKDIENDAISFETDYEQTDSAKPSDYKLDRTKVPQFRNIHISKLTCLGAKQAVNIVGLPSMPVHDVEMDDIVITSKMGFTAKNTSNIKLNNIKIIPEKENVFYLEDSNRYYMNNVYCPEGIKSFIKLTGKKSKDIHVSNTDTSTSQQAVKFKNGVSDDAISIE